MEVGNNTSFYDAFHDALENKGVESSESLLAAAALLAHGEEIRSHVEDLASFAARLDLPEGPIKELAARVNRIVAEDLMVQEQETPALIPMVAISKTIERKGTGYDTLAVTAVAIGMVQYLTHLGVPVPNYVTAASQASNMLSCFLAAQATKIGVEATLDSIYSANEGELFALTNHSQAVGNAFLGGCIGASLSGVPSVTPNTLYCLSAIFDTAEKAFLSMNVNQVLASLKVAHKQLLEQKLSATPAQKLLMDVLEHHLENKIDKASFKANVQDKVTKAKVASVGLSSVSIKYQLLAPLAQAIGIGAPILGNVAEFLYKQLPEDTFLEEHLTDLFVEALEDPEAIAEIEELLLNSGIHPKMFSLDKKEGRYELIDKLVKSLY